jgi:hypothetical protein
MGERFLFAEPEGTVCHDRIKLLGRVGRQGELEMETITTGKDKTSGIENAVSFAGCADHCGHRLGGAAFGFDLNFEADDGPGSLLVSGAAVTVITTGRTTITITTWRATAATVITLTRTTVATASLGFVE